MAEDIKDSEQPKELSTLRGPARNFSMFKDWLLGVSIKEIMRRYKISPNTLLKIRKKEDWAGKAKQITEMRYVGIGESYKKATLTAMAALMKDMTRITKKLDNDESVQLTDSERTHLRQLVEFANKNANLSEGKPTDISASTGVVEHRLILPPGMKRFGIIPPADNVKVIESTEEDQATNKNNDIDLSEFVDE